MSVDMYLSASKSQAASVQKMTTSQIAGYEECQQAISSFTMASPELTGAAYDNAKEYFSAVLYPLTRGGILLSEAVAEACQKFPDDYVAQVDSGDLKESELRAKISQLNAQMSELAELQERLRVLLYRPSQDGALDGSLASKMSGNAALMRSYERTKQKLEEQLDKLMMFHASSPAIFSEIDGLVAAIDLGSAQAARSFNPATGRFSIPKPGSMPWVETIERVEEKNALEKLRGYDIFYQEDAKMNPWSIRSRDKELSKKDREELQALLDKYGHKLDKKDYNIERLQRHEVLIFPGKGFAKIPKVLNKGWNLVRGINTVTTIGKLTPIGNAPSLANVREVAEDEALPQQGHVSGGVDGAPPVAAGKQGKHIEGHKANNQAKENNDSKNTWAEDTNGVRETQEGWINGSDVENRQGEVKEYDTGKVIGSDGETWIRVHIDKNGNIHGYPVHKK